MQQAQALVDALKANFGSSVVECSIHCEQVTLVVAKEDLLSTCEALRDKPEFAFEQLMDVCGVDYLHYGIDEWATDSATSTGYSRAVDPGHLTEVAKHREHQFPERFAVVYHLQSISLNQRLRLKVFVGGEPPVIDSVNDIWNSANWFEREAFDLYGINFAGHPDLRRILTDYGFVGHPFRKDFPVTGNVEMRYDAAEKRVLYEPVSIEPRTLVPKIIREDSRYFEEAGNDDDN